MFARKTGKKALALLLVCVFALCGVSLAYAVGTDITQNTSTTQEEVSYFDNLRALLADTTQEESVAQDAGLTQTTDAAQEEDVVQDADAEQDADTAQGVTLLAASSVVSNAVSTYSSSTEEGDIGDAAYLEDATGIAGTSTIEEGQLVYTVEGDIGDAAYLEDATGIAGTSTIEEGQLVYTVDQPSYTVETVSYSFSFSQMLAWQMTVLSSYTEDYVSFYLDPSNFPEGSYGFYQFLDLRTTETTLTAAQLNAYINSDSRGASGSLAGTGQYFIEAAQEYGINEVYLLAHAIHETGWGTSTLSCFYYSGGTINGVSYAAGYYYNFFGIGAVDSNALSGGQVKAITEGWNSPEAAIKGGAAWIAENYIYYSGTSTYTAQYTLYDMCWNPKHSEYFVSIGSGQRSWHQYATSPIWAERIAYFMYQCYTYTGTSPSSATYLVPSYQ